MDETFDFSVVVLTYQRPECAAEVLLHLRELRRGVPQLLEVVLVDNSEDNQTGQLVEREFPDVIYLRNPTNLGACGRNRGMMAAKGSIIITLDDDLVGLEPADLETIATAFQLDPKLAALNFLVTDYVTGDVCNWVHHRPATRARDAFPTYEITEGAVAFRSSALKQVGYYWERFFIGHEGPDLAFRLMDAGYRVWFDGRIVVRHKHEGQGRVSWRFYYYDTRNQIWLAARRMRVGLALRYLLIGQASMALYALRDGFFGWWCRAVFDGIRGLRPALRSRQPMLPHTAAAVRAIDRERNSFWTQVRKRLLRNSPKLEG